jgi:hypothetical protein
MFRAVEFLNKNQFGKLMRLLVLLKRNKMRCVLSRMFNAASSSVTCLMFIDA